MILVHLGHVTTAGIVRLHNVNHSMDVNNLSLLTDVNHLMDVNNLMDASLPMDVNQLMDVNNRSRLLALTVVPVNHLCLDIDQTHVKPANRLLRTTVVRHLTTTITVVGLSDVLISSAINRTVVLIIHDRTLHALMTNVLVHLLLSIVDPTPVLHLVAAISDATFVELLVAIQAITDHNLVIVNRISVLLLLQWRPIRFDKVHRDRLLHHVVIRKTTYGFPERAIGNPTITTAHLPVRSGAPGYPTPGCTKSPAPSGRWRRRVY